MALTKDRLKHSLAVATRMRVMAVDEPEDTFVLGMHTGRKYIITGPHRTPTTLLCCDCSIMLT